MLGSSPLPVTPDLMGGSDALFGARRALHLSVQTHRHVHIIQNKISGDKTERLSEEITLKGDLCPPHA